MRRLLMAAGLALALLATVLAATGCNSAPCAGHGGIRSVLGGWYYCNDGTREYG